MSDGSQCLPQGAVGQFNRRSPNPRLIAATHTFTDNQIDTHIAQPDLLWDGATWHLYYHSGHGDFAASSQAIIRHATTTDFVSWNIQDTPSLPPDDSFNAEPTVALDANHRFVMLYKSARGIIVATSTDGATFTPTGNKVEPPNLVSVSNPELVIVGDTFHLWFTANVRGIGHATSHDLVTWQFDEVPIPSLQRATADPQSGGSHPTVIYDEAHCRWEMWLVNDVPDDTSAQPVTSSNMAGVFHATSLDAKSWSITYSQARDLVWSSTENGEHLGLSAGADVAQKNGGRYMVYPAYDNQNVPQGSGLPTENGYTSGVMTLNLATRDVTSL